MRFILSGNTWCYEPEPRSRFPDMDSIVMRLEHIRAHIDSQRPPRTYDKFQEATQPPTKCNATAAREWKTRYGACRLRVLSFVRLFQFSLSPGNGTGVAKNDEKLRYNRQHDWVNRCIDVLVRLTRVLRDVHITPMLSSGLQPFSPSRNSLCNGCTLM